MPELTPEQWAPIRARAEKATPGPWTLDTAAYGGLGSVVGSDGMFIRVDILANDTAKSNGDFIAHARTDIPNLCDTADAQAKRIAELEAKYEPDCYCVCHSNVASRPSCEHCNGINSVSDHHLRKKSAELERQLSVLRGALETAQHHMVHREDVSEVCYDWCPLCKVKSALAPVAPTATTPTLWRVAWTFTERISGMVCFGSVEAANEQVADRIQETLCGYIEFDDPRVQSSTDGGVTWVDAVEGA